MPEHNLLLIAVVDSGTQQRFRKHNVADLVTQSCMCKACTCMSHTRATIKLDLVRLGGLVLIVINCGMWTGEFKTGTKPTSGGVT